MPGEGKLCAAALLEGSSSDSEQKWAEANSVEWKRTHNKIIVALTGRKTHNPKSYIAESLFQVPIPRLHRSKPILIIYCDERLEDFSARHSAEIKELYERANAASWKIPEAQWAGAIYRAAISREAPASPSSQGREYSISSTSFHAQNFVFALAFRLGCGEAMDLHGKVRSASSHCPSLPLT